MFNFNEFLFERYGVNQDVRHLTTLIYNKVLQYIPKLIREKEVTITNLLEENYKKINFINDQIILTLTGESGINEPDINSEKNIKNLTIYLRVNLNNKEIKDKYLSKHNKLRSTINHELNHIIELYHSKKRHSSWDFGIRLKQHQDKFEKYEEWVDISYFFYLIEDKEIRARISSLYETIKNFETKDPNLILNIIKSSKIYQDCNFLSKVRGDKLLQKMKATYPDFEDTLKDFVSNVLLSNGKPELVFLKQVQKMNFLAKKMKKKLLKSNNFLVEDKLETLIEKDIDYDKWL